MSATTTDVVTPSGPERMPLAVVLGVIVVSIAVLAFEIVQVRIFSYSIDPLLVFSAISVALLGLGAGGIAVSLRPSLARGDVGGPLAASLSGFALTSLVATAIFAHASTAVGFGTSSGILRAALPVFGLFIAPYFFAGIYLTVAMTRWVEDVGRTYFLNLVGSAIGCVIIYPLLRPFGAERIVAGIAAMAALTATAVARSSAPRFRAFSLAGALVSCALVPIAPTVFAFQPDPGDLYGVARAALEKETPGAREKDYLPVREFARWDPVSRVEVYSFPGRYGLLNETAPVRFFAQDGGAGSILLSLGEHDELRRALFEGTVYTGAYLLHPRPERALVIGLGGGPDIQAALFQGAKRITGVEINATTIDIIRNEYASFTGHPYEQPNVEIIHRDGRSFLERSTERYDVIQMSGTDTYAAGAAGAFMFSESYLYTLDAFERYWNALSDDGILAIIRFGLEPMRVVSTEIAALRALGVEAPERHIAVIGQGISTNVILSRRALSDDDGQRLARAVVERNQTAGKVHIPVYDVMGFGFTDPMGVLYAPGVPTVPNPYADILAATAAHTEGELLRSLPLDFSPVDDDRPFFFHVLAARHLPAIFDADNPFARGLRAHFAFLGAIGLFAAALILAPVAVLRRQGGGGRGAVRSLAYFACLGFGYLFVELTVMQKSALLLGHPTYSIAATLVTLLLASGMGSAFASRSSLPARAIVARAAAAIVLLLLLEHVGMHRVFHVILPAPFAVRVLVLVVTLFPLGFVMGMPFPIGLRATSARGEAAVAWALGINGFASVLASLMAVPLAMFWGFSAVLFVAVILYAGAGLLAPTIQASS